jgi:hypothetical protein
VLLDFSGLGATRLSVFLDSMFLGQVTNSSVPIWVQGDGYGCRANPWWQLPDGEATPQFKNEIRALFESQSANGD